MPLDPNQFEVIGEQASPDKFEVIEDKKPFDLSKIQLSPYDQYRLALAHGATPENYSELGIPANMNPDYDAVRYMGEHPLRTIGDVVSAPIKLAEGGIRKVMDTPTIIANKVRGTEDFNNPFHKETLSERSDEGETPIFRFPKSSGTGPVAGAVNTVSDFATGMLGNPEKIVLLAAAPGEGALGKAVAGAYGTQAAVGIPGAVKNAYDLTVHPKAGSTVAQEVQALAEPVIQGLFAKQMLGHAVGSESAPTPELQGPYSLGKYLNTPRGAQPELRVEDFEPLDTQSGAPISPQELVARRSRAPVLPETPEPQIKTFNLDEEVPNATETRQQPEGNQPEHKGDGGERTPAQASGGSGAPQGAPTPYEPEPRAGDARGTNDKEASPLTLDFVSKLSPQDFFSQSESCGVSHRSTCPRFGLGKEILWG